MLRRLLFESRPARAIHSRLVWRLIDAGWVPPASAEVARLLAREMAEQVKEAHAAARGAGALLDSAREANDHHIKGLRTLAHLLLRNDKRSGAAESFARSVCAEEIAEASALNFEHQRDAGRAERKESDDPVALLDRLRAELNEAGVKVDVYEAIRELDR